MDPNNNPTPPEIPEQPTQEPLPPASPGPLQPSPMAGMSGNELQATANAKKGKKRTVIGLVILVVILLLAGGAWKLQGTIRQNLRNSKYPVTTYDNGFGNTFSIRFFKGFSRTAESELGSLKGEALSASAANRYHLVAPDSEGKGITMSLIIQKESKYLQMKACDTPVFTVIAQHDKESEPVCPVSKDQPILYFYQFTKGSDSYLTLASLEYDKQAALNDKILAKQIASSTLTRYNDALKIILPSITVK